jgi:hypothetical protein
MNHQWDLHWVLAMNFLWVLAPEYQCLDLKLALLKVQSLERWTRLQKLALARTIHR